jgi:hypothetical protein
MRDKGMAVTRARASGRTWKFVAPFVRHASRCRCANSSCPRRRSAGHDGHYACRRVAPLDRQPGLKQALAREIDVEAQLAITAGAERPRPVLSLVQEIRHLHVLSFVVEAHREDALVVSSDEKEAVRLLTRLRDMVSRARRRPRRDG